MKDDHLIIVLVEPQGPLNVGSVCRSMMNFGFSRLRLVNPCSGYRGIQARKMALGAGHLLKSARCFDTLEQALADCHMALGTTRRFGKYRNTFYTPHKAGQQIAAQDDDLTCALVMGREDNGLTTEELSLCHAFVTIPTDDGYPSMNLSHALAVLLYETAGALNSTRGGIPKPGRPAPMGMVEKLYAHMRSTLLDIEYLDPQNPDHLLRTYRRIFSRAVLGERDVNIIRGLMSRIDWIESQRRKHAGTKGS